MADDFGQCVCGGAWFALAAPDGEEGPGVVSIDTEGKVTGWAGELVCAQCEEVWNPNIRFTRTRGHLRVIE